MTFYGTLVTGAGWIVPKKYVEQVGDDGFKKHPIGLGPYKFVSHTPGIELVMEANEGYWRKMPSVKRLVFKSVPESTTRLAMLKRGEVDVAYLLDVPQAQEVKRDPKLKLAFSGGIAIFFLDFLDQWDPKSPWADRRVRLAANYAIDRQALSEAETLGASKPAGNHRAAHLRVRAADRAVSLRSREGQAAARRGRLSRTASTPASCTSSRRTSRSGEAIIGYFQAVGIRMRMRPMERAAYLALIASKKAKGVCVCASALYGNAASRMSEVIPSDGAYAYGGYPDIDALYKQQALETDRKKREAMLHQIQQLVHERVRFGPIFEYIWPSGVGPARGGARADADQPLPVVGAARRGAAQEAVSGDTGAMQTLARHEATRYVQPLREGGSLPAVVDTDGGGLFVVKFRGAGQGAKALIAELIVGHLAQALGLPVPELAVIELSAAFGRTSPIRRSRTSCAAARGVNVGLRYLDGAFNFDVAAAGDAVPSDLATPLVWLDALVTNPDRTATATRTCSCGSTHSLAHRPRGRALRPPRLARGGRGAHPHAVSADPRSRPARRGAATSPRWTSALAAMPSARDGSTHVLAHVPDALLTDRVSCAEFASADEARARYRAYFTTRLRSPRDFVDRGDPCARPGSGASRARISARR